MTVAEKVRQLRLIEGQVRGLSREMTQTEVVAAIKTELGGAISQPYLSQIEKGQRRHLTNTSRLLLSRFFRVHPGYLVDDPEGFQTELITDFQEQEEKLDLWLVQGAERFRNDAALSAALLKLARHEDTRHCIVLLGAMLDDPKRAERFLSELQLAGGNENHELA